ncbi:hypothetical protein BJF78_21375 [Pseudonocardia sp. CNS-139]|nr:hypothetical protein BJF78_21375 [Pseudonocardia sp. CNS-139]
MSAWSWPRPDVVPVVVTAVGVDGANLHCYRDLRPGRDRAATIALPAGTQVVKIDARCGSGWTSGSTGAAGRYTDPPVRRGGTTAA